jgi:hypothetical protein
MGFRLGVYMAGVCGLPDGVMQGMGHRGHELFVRYVHGRCAWRAWVIGWPCAGHVGLIGHDRLFAHDRGRDTHFFLLEARY